MMRLINFVLEFAHKGYPLQPTQRLCFTAGPVPRLVKAFINVARECRGSASQTEGE